MTDQLPDRIKILKSKAWWLYVNFREIGWMDFVQTLQKKRKERKCEVCSGLFFDIIALRVRHPSTCEERWKEIFPFEKKVHCVCFFVKTAHVFEATASSNRKLPTEKKRVQRKKPKALHSLQ